jgi:hypothetical protein
MMKLAAAFAASLVSSAALAQGYVSAGLGVSNIGIDCPAAATCDTNDTAGKLTAGYGFGNGFAAELGYISFGKATGRITGASGEVKVDGITLGGALRAVVRDGGASFRFGIARLKASVSGTVLGVGSASDSATKTSPYLGIGFDAEISKRVKFDAAADISRAEYGGVRANVRALTLGLRFDF